MPTTSNTTETDYITTLDTASGQFTRVEQATGRSWTWQTRERPGKTVHSSKNGVTIEKLAQAGNSVRVKHFRWALYAPYRKSAPRDNELFRAMVVPSTFRQSRLYDLLPKGGYTHVIIKTKEGEYYMTSSECSENDPFCYAAGVAAALDRLHPNVIARLLECSE
jgi:hypothetical protein